MSTLHRKYRTTPRLTASDVAKWILALFPAATLMAMTFWPETVLPVVVQLIRG